MGTRCDVPRVVGVRHGRHGVTATPVGVEPTVMSAGFLVLVFTSTVETVPLSVLVTKAVLPSGVTATPVGAEPTVMSAGFLILVFTSIVDTVPLPLLVTTTVGRHRARTGAADTPSGTTPTSAPANPSTTTPRTQRTTVPCLAIRLGHRRHGVTATRLGDGPTAMSVGSLVLVLTSMVDTVPLCPLVT